MTLRSSIRLTLVLLLFACLWYALARLGEESTISEAQMSLVYCDIRNYVSFAELPVFSLPTQLRESPRQKRLLSEIPGSEQRKVNWKLALVVAMTQFDSRDQFVRYFGSDSSTIELNLPEGSFSQSYLLFGNHHAPVLVETPKLVTDHPLVSRYTKDILNSMFDEKENPASAVLKKPIALYYGTDPPYIILPKGTHRQVVETMLDFDMKNIAHREALRKKYSFGR